MNKSVFKVNVLAGLFLALSGNVSAATYTNVPSGASTGLPFVSFGNAANPSGDSPKIGQVFSVTSDESLSSFSFYAIGNTTASLQLNVAQWNPDTNAKNQITNLVGPSLLASISNASSIYNAAGGYTTISFENLDLSLNSDTKYIAYLTSSDLNVTGIQLSRTQTTGDISGFGIGHAFLSNIPGNGWQLPFNGNGFLSLQYTAITTPVPEPESYALFLAGLGIIGATAKRRSTK
jgi:hypothetical protein